MLAFLSALAIALTSCVLNVLVISTVIATRSMQHIGYYYVASQATCNLICAVLGAPPQALRQLIQSAYIDLICVLFIFLDTFYCNVFFLNTVSALLDCVFEQLRLLKLQRLHYNDKSPGNKSEVYGDRGGTPKVTKASRPREHQRVALFDQKRVRMKLALPWLLSCVQTVAMFAVTTKHNGFLHRNNLCLHDNLNFLSLRALLTIVVPCLVAVVLLLVYLRNSKRSIAHVIKESSRNPRKLAKQRVRKWLHTEVDADSESENSGGIAQPPQATPTQPVAVPPRRGGKANPVRPAAILKGANAHAAARTASCAMESGHQVSSTTVTLAPVTNVAGRSERPYSNGHVYECSEGVRSKPTVTFSDVAVVYTTSSTKRDFSLPDLHSLTKAGDAKRKSQNSVQHSNSSEPLRYCDATEFPADAENGFSRGDSRPQLVAHLLAQLHSLGTICRINLVSLITTACTWAIYIVGNLLYVIFGFNRSPQSVKADESSAADELAAYSIGTSHHNTAYYVLLYFRWAAYAGCVLYPLLVLIVDDACRSEVRRRCCAFRRVSTPCKTGATDSLSSSCNSLSQAAADDEQHTTCRPPAGGDAFPYRPPPSPPRHSASLSAFPPYAAVPSPIGFRHADVRAFMVSSQEQVAQQTHQEATFRFYTMHRPAPLSRSDPAFAPAPDGPARPSSFTPMISTTLRYSGNKTTLLHADEVFQHLTSLDSCATLPHRVARKPEKATASISPIRKALVAASVDNEEDSLLIKARAAMSPSLQLQNIGNGNTSEYF